MDSLRYGAVAEGLRSALSVYYHFVSEGGIDVERAGPAQFRVLLAGNGAVTFPDGRTEAPRGTFIMGPTTAAHQVVSSKGMAVFGFGLLAPGWTALTGRPASDWTDRLFELPDDSPLGRLGAAIAAAGDFEAMAAVADAALPGLVAMDEADMAFAGRVDSWLAGVSGFELTSLQQACGMSARTVTQHIKRLYGVTPKYLCRKYRALRAAREIADGADAAATLAANFYDQSHMIREVKRFTGLTPNQIRKGASELARLIDTRARLAGEISPLTARS